MIKKINIIDTNIFLDDPFVLNKFPNEAIVVPLAVIEELDKFKKDQGELGRNARWVIKELDRIRESNQPNQISNAMDEKDPNTFGVKLENGSRLMIELNHVDTLKNLDSSKMDNRILSVAKYFSSIFPKLEVMLISRDAALRIKADAHQVATTNYNVDGLKDLELESQFSGHTKMMVSKQDLMDFKKDSGLIIEHSLMPNQYVVLVDKSNENSFALGRYDEEQGAIVSINEMNNLWGISPKNIEQQFAIDALLNPDIPLVTLSGKAGTGKTLLSVAAGLIQSLDQNIYKKMLISRPVIPLGKDIGFLPGTLEEKVSPYMQSIFDNLEYIMGLGGGKNSGQRYKELIEQGMIQIEALTYIRGRSIPNQFFIIDEAQNLTKHEIKTIASRAGIGTKIILTGDPDQIDNPYVDKLTNGLSVLIEHLKDDKLSAHITLSKGERSPLAEMIVQKIK